MTPTLGNGKICYIEMPGGRPPQPAPGLLVYIMVDDAAATLEAIVANGGQVVQPIGADAPEITARFKDPAGNILGLYQQPAS